MKAIAGGSRDGRGEQAYSSLGLVLVLFGLVIAGVMLAPNLVLKVIARNRDQETQRLSLIREGYLLGIERNQVIPGPADWIPAASSVLGMDQTEVQQVFPDFPGDTNIRRVLLVDPGLGASTLPFTQTVAGVSGPATNLLGASSRVMLVSSTKRSLTLPVTNGLASQTNFDALWNWAYNPATKAPPSGWPAAWTRNAEYLHVERINLASLFHRITMTRLGYTLNDSSQSNVTSQVDVYALRGGMLDIYSSDSTLRFSRVINKDAVFNLSAYTSAPPVIYFKFQQTSGGIVTNFGSLGVPGNGRVTNGLSLGIAGPRPSSYPNFATNNYSADFDGNNDRVFTTNSVLNNLTAFTLACWIYPDANVANDRTGLIGQNDAVELGFITATTIQIWSSTGGQLTISYPYAIQQWHHITATGDGTELRLYFDGVLAGSVARTTSNYGTSGYTFNVGGDGVFDPPGSSALFNGKIDEVVFYDRALSAAEISTLATGVIP